MNIDKSSLMNLCDIENIRENGQTYIAFMRSPSPTDGHCFVYSILKAIRSQPITANASRGANLHDVIDLIKTEAYANMQRYLPFI